MSKRTHSPSREAGVGYSSVSGQKFELIDRNSYLNKQPIEAGTRKIVNLLCFLPLSAQLLIEPQTFPVLYVPRRQAAAILLWWSVESCTGEYQYSYSNSEYKRTRFTYYNRCSGSVEDGTTICQYSIKHSKKLKVLLHVRKSCIVFMKRKCKYVVRQWKESVRGNFRSTKTF